MDLFSALPTAPRRRRRRVDSQTTSTTSRPEADAGAAASTAARAARSGTAPGICEQRRSGNVRQSTSTRGGSVAAPDSAAASRAISRAAGNTGTSGKPDWWDAKHAAAAAALAAAPVTARPAPSGGGGGGVTAGIVGGMRERLGVTQGATELQYLPRDREGGKRGGARRLTPARPDVSFLEFRTRSQPGSLALVSVVTLHSSEVALVPPQRRPSPSAPLPARPRPSPGPPRLPVPSVGVAAVAARLAESRRGGDGDASSR